MDLFDYHAQKDAEARRPLAERMRPRCLAEFIGQRHAVGEGSLIRLATEQDRVFSMILWGPPGCGKTTLARIIAGDTRSHFVSFSAVLSGVKEIRAVIEAAREQQRLHRRRTVLFVDEIHRFNKAQQDAFLPRVEAGDIVLVGATTENPSFEVNAALLSRSKVFVLRPLTAPHLVTLLERALDDPERGLGASGLTGAPEALAAIARHANGDARVALNLLELAAGLVQRGSARTPGRIDVPLVAEICERRSLVYDKTGEEHFNLISALHKAMRNSDPDAAVYWLARMLEAGEDPLYVARRLVRFASEDVGNADPRALAVTVAAKEAAHFLGMPEANTALAQAAIYLATAPKSNATYMAYRHASSDALRDVAEPVPLHLRNAPTDLMRDLGYGEGYQYAHDEAEGIAAMECLPPALRGRRYYVPTDRGFERDLKRRLEAWEALKKRGAAERDKDE